MQQPSGPSVCLKVITDDINTVEEKNKKRGRQGREKTTAKQIVTKFPRHKVVSNGLSRLASHFVEGNGPHWWISVMWLT